MSRYLITGVTGFLGRALARNLAGAGHEVVGLARDRATTPIAGVTKLAQGDVLSEADVSAALDGVDGIFHAAGLVSRDPRDAEAMWRVHVLGTRAVLAAARAKGVPRIVLASTSGTVAVREDDAAIPNEDSPRPTALAGRFPYYRSKLYAEEEALSANDQSLSVISINPSLLLGPGDLRGTSTRDVALFLSRSIPAVPSGGVSFVDVRDAALGMALAMERGAPGRRYLLSGCNLPFSDFFARLERLSGIAAPRASLPKGSTFALLSRDLLGRVAKKLGGELPVDRVSVEMGQLFWYADSARAQKELGWAPRDPGETLSDTVRELMPRRTDDGSVATAIGGA
jgi:dihydroflavonol-4-reductase